MSVAAIGSAHVTPIGPQKAEGPVPKQDGDADDSGVKPPVQAAPAPGTGAVVNKKA
jgi:hypothetical protein